MLYVICGFIFGGLIPYLARRIGKLISLSMGGILLKIWWPNHYMPWEKLKNNETYMRLWRRYMMRSLGWGIFTAAMTCLFALNFDTTFVWMYIVFLWILLLAVEVDKRFMLLPDILTLPLLILGFAYAAMQGYWLALTEPYFIGYAANSALGAATGFIIPLVASLFVVWKYPDAFGDGDIKLLTAIGAWVGFQVISYIILAACVFFAVNCLINKQRAGAFGPSVVYATLAVVIFHFAF